MNSLFRNDRLFLVVLVLGLFAMAARNVTDPDVWWHLKTGQYISEHKSVPHTDPFSYTRAGEPWVAHEWLTDLLLYQCHRCTGFAALIVVFAVIVSAAFYLLHLRSNSSPYTAGIPVLCGAWATAPIWGVRPQVLTLLLTSLWLLILERSERRPNLLWWTLPLTLLWVNLHAGFAQGLALSALFLVGGLIERFLGHSRSAGSLRMLALTLFFDLLLVPLNPNGLRLFSYPIETLRSAAMQDYIAEWASPNFHNPEYWPFLLIVLATFVALSWSRLPFRPRDLILLLVSLYAGLASIRMIPLFILIVIPLISTRLGTWPRQSQASVLLNPSRSLVNIAIVLAMLVFATTRALSVIQHQPSTEVQQFPAGAVAFLRAHPPLDPILNHYDWGGYLIWKLPATPVFIDGRADLYGPALLHDFADAYQLRNGWRQVLTRWHIKTVIVPSDSALASGLRAASPPWIVCYQDPKAIVLALPSPPAHVTVVCN